VNKFDKCFSDVNNHTDDEKEDICDAIDSGINYCSKSRIGQIKIESCENCEDGKDCFKHSCELL
jgi:hypothetical protein